MKPVFFWDNIATFFLFQVYTCLAAARNSFNFPLSSSFFGWYQSSIEMPGGSECCLCSFRCRCKRHKKPRRLLKYLQWSSVKAPAMTLLLCAVMWNYFKNVLLQLMTLKLFSLICDRFGERLITASSLHPNGWSLFCNLYTAIELILTKDFKSVKQ